MSGEPWTVWQLRILTQMRSEKYSAKEIAEVIKKSEWAVFKKLSRLKILIWHTGRNYVRD